MHLISLSINGILTERLDCSSDFVGTIRCDYETGYAIQRRKRAGLQNDVSDPRARCDESEGCSRATPTQSSIRTRLAMNLANDLGDFRPANSVLDGFEETHLELRA